MNIGFEFFDEDHNGTLRLWPFIVRTDTDAARCRRMKKSRLFETA
jgi:hypothetical protein